MVARLDLAKYKATIKGLTQFGDRRQGTDRNRAAVDWIEAQLKSYGCTPTERVKYIYKPARRDTAGRGGAGGGRGGAGGAGAAGGGRGRGNTAQGGGRLRGIRTRTGVNTDALKQPDAKLRRVEDIVRRVEALPAVRATYASNFVPLSGGGGGGTVIIDGHPAEKGKEVGISVLGVTPHFNTTMGLPMVEGRDFTDAEGCSRSPVDRRDQQTTEGSSSHHLPGPVVADRLADNAPSRSRKTWTSSHNR